MPRRIPKLLAGVAVLFLLLLTAALFVNEPLRAYVEHKMNRSLKGYHVRIGSLAFHPIGGSVDLEDVQLTRNDEPDPPVARIARWSANRPPMLALPTDR